MSKKKQEKKYRVEKLHLPWKLDKLKTICETPSRIQGLKITNKTVKPIKNKTISVAQRAIKFNSIL